MGRHLSEGHRLASELSNRMMRRAVAPAVTWRNVPMFWKPVPANGWALMAYERKGKPVCRYFYAEREDG